MQIDHARVGETRHADHVALQRPAERHGVVGVPEREILARAVQRRGACHCGEPSVPLLVKLLFGPVAEVRYGHPTVSRTPSPVGVGEMPQVERAVVEDAVIAAGELREAGDGAVVDDLRIAGNSAVGQCADAAVIGQGRGAAGRAEDNAGGRQTEGRANTGKRRPASRPSPIRRTEC